MPKRDLDSGESKSRFSHIDGMRAFAVMLVVVAHAGLDRVLPGPGLVLFLEVPFEDIRLRFRPKQVPAVPEAREI